MCTHLTKYTVLTFTDSAFQHTTRLGVGAMALGEDEEADEGDEANEHSEADQNQRVAPDLR